MNWKKYVSVLVAAAALLTFSVSAAAEAPATALGTTAEAPATALGTAAEAPGGQTDTPGEKSYNIEDYSFSLSQTKFFFDGESKKPAVISADGLTEDVDYTVSYEEGSLDAPGAYCVQVTGCGEYVGGQTLSYEIVRTSVTCSKSRMTLYPGASAVIRATVENPNGKTVFSSSNRKVAKVNSKGKVTAVKKGTAKITVRNGYASCTVTITVRNPEMSKKKLTIYNSENYKLRFKGVKGKVTWTSSNKSVASVTKKGLVKANKAGTCVIRAKCGQYKASCRIKVPAHYRGYAGIPDFGAKYGRRAIAVEEEDNEVSCGYRGSKAEKASYVKSLLRKGFYLFDRDEGVDLYMNDSFDLVGIGYDAGLVMIVYGNALDS